MTVHIHADLTQAHAKTSDAKTSPAVVDRRTKMLAILNIASFILTIVGNYLIAGGGIVSSYTIGEVSKMYRTLLNPGGFAFAIWPIIYMFLCAFVVWQARPLFAGCGLCASEDTASRTLNLIGPWFTLSGVFNVLWICLFVQAEPAGWIWASSALLFAIVFCLARIQVRVGLWHRIAVVDNYGRLRALLFGASSMPPPAPPTIEEAPVTMVGKTGITDERNEDHDARAIDHDKVGCTVADDKAAHPIVDPVHSQRRHAPSLFEILVVEVGFSLYFGWTTGASIVNASCALVASGFDGGKEAHIYAIVMLCIAAVLYLKICLCEGNFVFAAVYTWIALAIYVDCVLKLPEDRFAEAIRLGNGGEDITSGMSDAVGYCALTLGIIVGLVASAQAALFFRECCHNA